MTEKLGRILPFVVLELPRLACGEHRDDSIPVVRSKVRGVIHKDEASRVARVDSA